MFYLILKASFLNKWFSVLTYSENVICVPDLIFQYNMPGKCR